VQASTTVASLTLTAPTLPPPTIPTISQVQQAPTPPTTAPSTFLQNLPNFGSLFRFDHHLKTLEANFSEFVQTNQFARAVSSILDIVERYMDQRMNEEIKDDDDQDDNNDDQDTDNDGDDFVHPKLSIHEEEAKDEERFDPIVQTPKNSDDEGNDDASLGLNAGIKVGPVGP
nr:hypothetical protein [Tanacetum cinerariifolium]